MSSFVTSPLAMLSFVVSSLVISTFANFAHSDLILFNVVRTVIDKFDSSFSPSYIPKYFHNEDARLGYEDRMQRELRPLN